MKVVYRLHVKVGRKAETTDYSDPAAAESAAVGALAAGAWVRLEPVIVNAQSELI